MGTGVLTLFHCEKFRADLSAAACLVNQARGHFEGDLSAFFKCTVCELGKLYLEAAGGELPQVIRDGHGQIRVVRPRGEAVGKHAVKINGEVVTMPSGQVLTASTPAAAERIAGAVAPKDEKIKPRKPCKNHPDREALPENNMCRECQQAYQREWYARKRSKQGEPMQAEDKVVVIGKTEAALAQEAAAKLCIVCKEKPRHKKSNRCLECLTEPFNRPEVKAKRLAGIGEQSRRAHKALALLESGQLVAPDQRYAGIFTLVEGLQEKIEARAAQNLRTLEAEMAILLREALL